MTIDEWNQLHPGDWFALNESADVRYRVYKLDQIENWGDTGTTEQVYSRSLWAHFLGDCEDRGCLIQCEPGEANYYRRVEYAPAEIAQHLRGIEPAWF
jgi:hypothetical protein